MRVDGGCAKRRVLCISDMGVLKVFLVEQLNSKRCLPTILSNLPKLVTLVSAEVVLD